ncbi:MAG: winged helix-turn-helix transcriptional regulator [Brevundimonas sp.]
MDNAQIPGCPVACGVAVFGDPWSIMILRDAHLGLTRFDQFRKSLGIAPTMLSRRLATLTSEGLLEKRVYSSRPPRDEYVLTQAGRDILPILMLIGAWSHRHRGLGLAHYVDAETGQAIRPVGVDAVTGHELGSRPIKLSA